MLMTQHHLWRLSLVLVTMAQFACFAEAGLTAGASRKSIVPPFPTQMGGFFDRLKNFEGVHDEVFARALVLDNGSNRLAVVSCDLMSVDAEMVRLARLAITSATTIPPTNILICSTHNHSAPSYYQKTAIGQDDVEPSLKQFLARQISETAIEAHANLKPARLGFAAGNLVGLTRNRQQGNDLIDPQVGVLRVEELEGRKTIATLFNFTGHPVVIGSTNMLLSGEYPGAASRAVEHLLGGVALFTQGACGDITVNRDGDPFLEIERLGRIVAGEVIKTSGLVKFEASPVLKSASSTITLPAIQLPKLEEANAALAASNASIQSAKQQKLSEALIRKLENKNRVLSMTVQRIEAITKDPSKKETELNAEVQVLQIGPALYGAIPGELFVEYALELRSRIKQETGNPFCLVGYANGHLGYIVTPRAMETGGYEASITRLNVLAGRTLTETTMSLVERLSTP